MDRAHGDSGCVPGDSLYMGMQIRVVGLDAVSVWIKAREDC